MDIFDLFARYQIKSSIEFEQKIKKGNISEHPGWEDLIVLENLEQKLLEIEDDIRIIS